MSRPPSNLEPAEFLRLCQTIGHRARAARVALGLIQVEVAERLEVSAEFYARIERAKALPSVRTLFRICDTLNVSADCLLGHKDMPALEPRAVSRLDQHERRVRKLIRTLRCARPETLRLVRWVLCELQRASRPSRKKATAKIRPSEARAPAA